MRLTFCFACCTNASVAGCRPQIVLKRFGTSCFGAGNEQHLLLMMHDILHYNNASAETAVKPGITALLFF